MMSFLKDMAAFAEAQSDRPEEVIPPSEAIPAMALGEIA